MCYYCNSCGVFRCITCVEIYLYYMCGRYTPWLRVWNMSVSGVLHMYHRCMNYMCNTPKTPHMYYMCITHVIHMWHIWYTLDFIYILYVWISLYRDTHTLETWPIPTTLLLYAKWWRLSLGSDQFMFEGRVKSLGACYFVWGGGREEIVLICFFKWLKSRILLYILLY